MCSVAAWAQQGSVAGVPPDGPPGGELYEALRMKQREESGEGLDALQYDPDYLQNRRGQLQQLEDEKLVAKLERRMNSGLPQLPPLPVHARFAPSGVRGLLLYFLCLLT